MSNERPDPITMPHSGPFNAIIAKTWIGSRTADDAEYAPADQVSYDVIVNFPDGPIVFEKQVPNHRRPILGVDIEPARPNDECVACLRGPLVRFFIIEGIPTQDCTNAG